MQNFIVRITQENDAIINEARIGCFILAETLDAKYAQKFIKAAQSRGKLVLTEGKEALQKYKIYGADGLIVDVAKETAPQKLLKQIKVEAKGAVIGAICRNRRHEAMLVSECEPDFIVFRFWRDGLEENRKLLSWYSELFLIQCAAQIEEELDYSLLPADFIILNDKF